MNRTQSSKLRRILSKIFPKKTFDAHFSLQMTLWYFHKLFFVFFSKLDSVGNVQKNTLQIWYLKKMTVHIKRLEKYIGSSITMENIFSLYDYISVRYSAANYPQGSIPLFENWVEHYPTHIAAWHRLATLLFWSGDVEGVKKIYQRHILQRNLLAEKVGIDIHKNRYFATTYTSAIGHICILGFYAMLKILEGPNSIRNVLYLDPNNIANRCLLNYLTPMYDVVVDSNLEKKHQISYLDLEDPWLLMRKNNDWEYFYDGYVKIIDRWESEKKTPFLKLNEKDIEYGWKQLNNLGVPKDAWFVALHIRDAKSNEVRHGEINSYLPAIKKIVDAGGWVIRLGDSSMPRLPKLPQVIDYAHSTIKSDRMDVFLIGDCKFFIGTNSGPTSIPGFFGKRCLQTNYAPLMYHSPYSKDILVPILFRSRTDGKLLSFQKILSSPLVHAEYPTAIPDFNVEAVPNTPIDLLLAVEEMLNLVDSNDDSWLKNSPLQIKFQSVCKENNIVFRPMLSGHFLDSHATLL